MRRHKYILAPDSFKGTMSSVRICQIMEERIAHYDPEAEILSVPIADGGEGSVDCFLHAVPGLKICRKVTGPFMGETADACYALIDNGKTAVLETASCAGLILAEGRENPCLTTTYGLGQLLLDAVGRGAEKIILGLGGSATNDGGCGMAAATGVRFYDRCGREFIPTGGNLCEIEHIDISAQKRELKGISFVCMCDIDNPMHGHSGAAEVFAPQKGADKEMVCQLDRGLKYLDQKIRQELRLEVAEMPGAGAAGGLGAGAAAFFQGELQAGIDVVLDTVGFDKMLAGATMVFTGEGRLDSQSLRGKAVIGIAAGAMHRQVPVIAVAGAIGDDVEQAYDRGISAMFSINRKAEDFLISRGKSEENLYHTMDDILRFYKCFYN